MKTKVCPCCDQPIQGIYCKGCRKIVLHPVEQNIHYYLNERHPEHETDCSYHGNTAAGTSAVTDPNVRNEDHRMTPYEAEAKKAEIKERMLQKQRELQSAGAKTKKPLKKFLIVLFIYFIFNFIGVIFVAFQDISHTFDNFEFGVATPEPGFAVEEAAIAVEPERETVAPSRELEDWERTDEEVKAAGVACTGYGHFDLTYEEAELYFLEYMKEDGLICEVETPYSYNSQMDHDSWYQTVYSYTVLDEEEYVGIIDLETDTATGQIHGICMYTSEEEGFFKMADAVMKFLEGTGLASEELPSGYEFYQIAMGEDGKMQKDCGVVVMFDMEVSCYVPEDMKKQDFYSMSIYAPGYYTTVTEY